MVCLGNICRSPMAEGLLKQKIDAQKVIVDSAGTSGYHIGQPPDPRMITTAKNHEVDISTLKGRQFQVEDFDAFDRIFAMDNSNYKDILSLARHDKDRAKVYLITNLCYPGEDRDVPDPYFGGPEGFEKVYALLDRCTTVLAENLSKEE